LEQLESKDIHIRADAGRQLSRVGTPEHLPALIRSAFADKSPGVRLYAVCAAADILSRYRVGPSRNELSLDNRKAILDSFRSVDPSRNPGMFSVIACVGLPRSARRLLVGLQDPRLDVRTGAIVGCYRYFVSHGGAGDDATKAALLDVMRSGRLRPDALAGTIRLCARCHWTDTVDLISGMRGRFNQVDEAIDQALAWMGFWEDPISMRGVWASYGSDAAELSAHVEPVQMMVLAEGVGTRIGETVETFTWSLDDGAFTVDGATHGLRRMWLDEPTTHVNVAALQLGPSTWYRADAPAPSLLERFAEGIGALPAERAAPLAQALVSGLPTTPSGQRTAARVEVSVGLFDAALARLEPLSQRTRGVPNDLQFWLGEARAGAGDLEGARTAWQAFVVRAKDSNPMMERAKGRLAQVSPE
jgi:hypothetical protein